MDVIGTWAEVKWLAILGGALWDRHVLSLSARIPFVSSIYCCFFVYSVFKTEESAWILAIYWLTKLSKMPSVPFFRCLIFWSVFKTREGAWILVVSWRTKFCNLQGTWAAIKLLVISGVALGDRRVFAPSVSAKVVSSFF